MVPRRTADSPQASFASFIPLRTNSPPLEEIINGIWRHEKWIWNTGGVGRWAGVRFNAFSGPSPPWGPRILLGWDLINHQDTWNIQASTLEHVQSFSQRQAEKYIPDASKRRPSSCQKKMPIKKLKRGWREGGRDKMSKYPKMLKIGDSSRYYTSVIVLVLHFCGSL